jgi:exonuclease III
MTPSCTNLPVWQSFFVVRALHISFSIFSRCLILTLLFISGIHPNAGPTPSTLLPLSVILQLNCNGLSNSVSEIDAFLRLKCVGVAALQETFLSNASIPPVFPDYTLLRKDCPQGRGGGLALLIHHSVTFSPIDLSFLLTDETECQAVRVSINGSDIVLFNVYLPPVSSCPRSFDLNLSPVFHFSDDDILVCGDLNTHHGEWDSSLTDPQGRRLLT